MDCAPEGETPLASLSRQMTELIKSVAEIPTKAEVKLATDGIKEELSMITSKQNTVAWNHVLSEKRDWINWREGYMIYKIKNLHPLPPMKIYSVRSKNA